MNNHIKIRANFVQVRYDVAIAYDPAKDYPQINNESARDLNEHGNHIKGVRYKCLTNVGQIVKFDDDKGELTFGVVGRSEKECPSVCCKVGENYFNEKNGKFINWYFDGYTEREDLQPWLEK